MITDTDGAEYTYDLFNRMTCADLGIGAVYEYSYDGDGKRIRKTSLTEDIHFIWDGMNLAEQIEYYLGTYTDSKQFIYGVDLSFGLVDGDIWTYYTNLRGDIAGYEASSGNTVVYKYDAWGNLLNPTENDENPFRFAGEYQDLCSGLIYLRNRYYDPSIGRFITEDPARDGLNWYIYANNNPVNYIDPLGLDAVLITADHAAMWQGHTSIITQDTRNGNWYYFYWGDKATYFVEVPWEDGAMGSLKNFNSWLNKQDLPYSTKNYTSATFVEGDFNASVDYFKNLVSGTTIEKGYRMEVGRYDKPTMEYYQINKSYDLWDANCLQMSMKGFYKGTLKDGTKVSSFMKGQLDKTKLANVRPNTAEEVFNQLFFNRRFTRASAKNDVTWEALYGSPDDRYKNKGLHYAKTLGVSK